MCFVYSIDLFGTGVLICIGPDLRPVGFRRVYMRSFITILVYTFFIGWVSSVSAQTVFTARGPETPNDHRYDYQQKLLELALEKTREDYGDFTLVKSRMGSNTKRAMWEVETGLYENYFVANAVTPKRLENLVPVPFPIDLGILGYRVFFTSEETKERLRSVSALEDLKKFRMVQGLGWSDSEILKNAGFQVAEASDYHGMFQMVANNRVDLFPRGINEFLNEWRTNKHIENLSYDEGLILYYPFPKFFYTTQGNEAQAGRIMTGLVRAYDDGSLVKLWEAEYKSSIDQVGLLHRKILSIPNPNLAHIVPDYKKYFYFASQNGTH